MPFATYILLPNRRLSGWALRPRCGCFPKLGRGVLRPCVVDEGAGSELHPCQQLEPVFAAVRRIELEMQMRLRPGLTVGRGLVKGHHIGRRESEVAVVHTGHTKQRPGQVPPLGLIEVRDGARMPSRVEVDLIGPPRGPRDERDYRA